MSTRIRTFPNLYRDSVTLMQVSATLAKREGIRQASAVMASPANLELLRAAGLLDAEGKFGTSDLLIALAGEDSAIDAALDDAQALLSPKTSKRGGSHEALAPRSIEMALKSHPTANLALIATPGEYAAAEARKALALGLNVMLFSDNVQLSDEIALKVEARRRGLLVMGPDCGTAVIDGVPLGFANAVRRGPVGVVAASGTGLQQVACLVDRHGSGISQAIGTGGRDLKADVGGITMLHGLELLAADTDTQVIVLVSKPPARAVAERILAAAAAVPCPVVVNFLGASIDDRPEQGLFAAATLAEAATRAVDLAQGRDPAVILGGPDPLAAEATALLEALAPRQRFVRGLFTGGTFCYETLLLLSAACGKVWSNTPLDSSLDIGDPWTSREHTLIDLGDDAFTRGRPHPMIDPGLRNERIVEEASDPEVAVILLDLVLGYGAHADPAAPTATAVLEARARAEEANRTLLFVASVCGTASDPQGLSGQEATLREAGVLLAPSNADAARLAAAIALRAQELQSATRQEAGR